MSEDIKLNEWRRGVVPELHPQAVVAVAGTGPTPRDWVPIRYSSLTLTQCERWYAILSTEPPKLPEPELRLPEGWQLGDDEAVNRKEWMICVERFDDGNMTDSYTFYRPSRRECVEEINRILEGK